MFLLSGSTDIKLHNCETWNVKFTFGNNKKLLEDLKWSDEGKYVIQISNKNGAEILCVTDKSIRCVQNISIKNSSAAAFYKESARNIAIGTVSGKTYIWDTKSKNILKTYESASSAVKFLDFNAKNNVLSVALDNNDVLLYGTTSNTQVTTVKIPQSNTISALKFHKEYRSVIGITTDEGAILLRDINRSKDKMFLEAVHNAPLTGMCFSPVNRDVLASCSYDTKIQIYDIRSNLVVNTIQTERCLSCIDMNINNYVAVGTNIGEILMYDLRNYKKPVHLLKDHDSTVKYVAFQPFSSKSKKNSTFNISIKGMGDAKVNTKDTNRSLNISDVSDHSLSLVRPPKISPTPSYKSKDVITSKDSFIANIIDETAASQSTANTNFLNVTSNSKISNFDSPNNVPISISASTPVEIRNGVLLLKSNNENVSPSPILKNKINVYESIKIYDSPGCESTGETVKDETNHQIPPQILSLVSELKNDINYTIYTELQEHKKTLIRLAIRMAKNRVEFEDQINALRETQDCLVEEIKRLVTENETLKSNMYK